MANESRQLLSPEEEEEEEEEEQSLFFYVPYIHNGYVYDHLIKHGNAETAKMLIDLPLCHNDDRSTMTACLTRLKKRRATFMKMKSRTDEGERLFTEFNNAEFVFPIPKETERSCLISNKFI